MDCEEEGDDEDEDLDENELKNLLEDLDEEELEDLMEDWEEDDWEEYDELIEEQRLMELEEDTNEFGLELEQYFLELEYKNAELEALGLRPANQIEPEMLPGEFTSQGELLFIFNVDMAVPDALANIML